MQNHNEKINSLIRILHQHTEFISGETISKTLHITRASVWKYIEQLRTIGYYIEAQPHRGYRLVSIPDNIIAAEIQLDLHTAVFGKEILVFPELDSTNAHAAVLAQAQHPEGTVIIAERQTKGRGRLGRTWVSYDGGVYCSIILRPPVTPQEATEITLFGAVSLCHLLSQQFGLPAKIRWPNDVLICQKKVAGILTELEAEQDRVHFVILGIGINCNTSLKLLPEEASSLKEELGAPVSRIALIRELLTMLDYFYALWLNRGFQEIAALWRQYSSILGRIVRVDFRDTHVEGVATDIDEQGALLIRLDNGIIKKITAGDVTLLR
ncbi:MAG: biotin--[acetyl-CoA-carboxylase] ligase [Candidatus Omnitrophica bacterium]|nr:biotin--[acetyl-CoA-carboxylase] ligase [Candidatus Omnitrophota bacterium]